MRRKWVSYAGALVIVLGFAFVGAYLARMALLPRRSLTFPEQVDLGTVEPDEVLKASFTIKNQSSGPVRLSDFSADCECMGLFQVTPSGSARLEPVLLNAGQELAVSASFAAPGGGKRAFAHRVTFTADPPPPQPSSVLLTGTVQLRMYAEPSTVSWEPLRPHQTAAQVVRLVDFRKPPERTPFTLVSDHDSVTVESVEKVEGTEELSGNAGDGQVYRVKLKVQAGGEGEVSGSVLVLSGDEKTKIHSIPFYASVGPPIRLKPATVVFPRPGSADPFSARILLIYDSPCQVDLGPAPEGFRLEKDGSLFLVVGCDPEALPEPGKHTLVVHAKAADGTTHRLTLTVVIANILADKPEG